MMQSKDPSESVVLEFDFSGELASISGATVTAAIAGNGADPDIAYVVDGAAQISGTSVLQRMSAGVAGLNYRMRCEATDGSNIIVRSDIVPVRAA